jgi:hypothetical protein
MLRCAEYGIYDGELMYFKPKLTPEEQMYLLENHPFFTGKCPKCDYIFDKSNPPVIHFDCPECGWIDDSV